MDNIKHIKKVAEDLKLRPTQAVLNILNHEWGQVLTTLNAINEIDTTNVEPMIHIDETPTTYMREDEIEHGERFRELKLHIEEGVIEGKDLFRKIAFKNADEVKDDFIIIKKVIND